MFTGNQAVSAGALAILEVQQANITSCTFQGNMASVQADGATTCSRTSRGAGGAICANMQVGGRSL